MRRFTGSGSDCWWRAINSNQIKQQRRRVLASDTTFSAESEHRRAALFVPEETGPTRVAASTASYDLILRETGQRDLFACLHKGMR